MNKKALLISVNMGYGHQRTAYPLRDLAFEGKIINANDYPGIPVKDKQVWESTRTFYEFISNFKKIPLIGEFAFFIIDQFQKIFGFYPKRDLSNPSFQLKQNASLIGKGWGKHLIISLDPYSNCSKDSLKEPMPLVSTFFTPAFMAEFFNYPGEIYCVVCDADISRAWAPLNPENSKIKYFAPTDRVTERLKLYGVKRENIFFTGYPLPLENIGDEKMGILKEDLKNRLLNLDPKRKYFEKYEVLIKEKLGNLPARNATPASNASRSDAGWHSVAGGPDKTDHPLTIMFCVGGAGAQKEIAIKILKSLKAKIDKREIKIILVAGIKEWVRNYFIKNIKKTGIKNDENVEIIFEKDIESYFKKFNQALRKTDILWTKPSELSFYSALGLPIIIAPTVGSQEEFNMRWLLKSGFGIFQENPKYTEQWLFDWLDRGYLAEAAMQGFVEGEKLGTINIKKIIES